MPKILIVSASMGAGHNTAARELQRRVERRGGSAVVIDWLTLAGPRQGPALRTFYRGMLRRTPRAYDLSMRAWAELPRVFERITAAGTGSYLRGFRRAFDHHQPDLVVATYNLAGQAVGRLRTSGTLDVPVVVSVTDAGAHPYWVARGADRHLAPLAATADALAGMGAAEVRTVAPLVPPPSEVTRATARKEWGFARDGRLAVLSGGSWGVGAALAATRALTDAGITPAVLCGRNERLLLEVGAIAGAYALGWTDEVATLIRAADVVVDSGGGATSWEALAASRPLVLHRPLPGHGRLNAETLRATDLAVVTRDEDDLIAAIVELASSRAPGPGPARDVFAAADPADEVLALLEHPSR